MIGRPSRPPDQRVLDLQRHLVQVIRRRTPRRRNHQLPPVLVHQHDRAYRRVQRLRHHLRYRLQNAVQVILRRDGLRHRGQRLHALGRRLRTLLQPRLGDRPAHLLPNEAHQRDLLRCVRVRLPVVNVDHSDQLPAAHQRHRKERVESVLRQRLERLEPRVRRGLVGQRHHRLVLRHPPRDALAHPQPDVADLRVVRKLRRPQHHFVALPVHQVHQARVAMRGLQRQPDQLLKHLLQAQIRADNAADVVQERDLGSALGHHR